MGGESSWNQEGFYQMLELCLETSALAACRGRTIPVNNRASFRLSAAEGCDFVRHHFCFLCRESFKTLRPGTRAFYLFTDFSRSILLY